jgi:hypothetical protein
MDIEEGFSLIERAATMSIVCETVRLSAFRAAKRSRGNGSDEGLATHSRFTARLSQKIIVRRQRGVK